jgi:hypothetical protein
VDVPTGRAVSDDSGGNARPGVMPIRAKIVRGGALREARWKTARSRWPGAADTRRLPCNRQHRHVVHSLGNQQSDHAELDLTREDTIIPEFLAIRLMDCPRFICAVGEFTWNREPKIAVRFALSACKRHGEEEHREGHGETDSVLLTDHNSNSQRPPAHAGHGGVTLSFTAFATRHAVVHVVHPATNLDTRPPRHISL